MIIPKIKNSKNEKISNLKVNDILIYEKEDIILIIKEIKLFSEFIAFDIYKNYKYINSESRSFYMFTYIYLFDKSRFKILKIEKEQEKVLQELLSAKVFI